MKKIFTTFILLSLITSLGMAQSKKEIDVDDFTKLSFGVAGKLYLVQGSEFKVVFEGDKDLLDEITTKVSDNRLVIRKPNWRRAMNKKLTAYVTMPDIEGISVSGSGTVICEESIKSDDLDLGVSGSGNIYLENLKAESIDAGISGSGGVTLDGSGADMIDLSISGSGSYSAEDFKVNNAEISISGSGKCKVWVEGKLEARISGSGSVYYKGDPNIDSRSSGSGKVRKL